MVNNRKMRRAAAATEPTANGNGEVKLSASQQKKIASVYAEVIAVERRVAALDMEKDGTRALLRQKQQQLYLVCSNALREHGIDLDDPQQNRWRINPETMEVVNGNILDQGSAASP